MKKYFVALILFFLSVGAVSATVGLLSLRTGWTPSGSCTTDGNDGFAGAPAGVAAQFPNALSSYNVTFRPTWCVAGVHYGVGYPAATVLKDPSSVAPPACVTRDNVNRIYTVNGDDCVIDSWDFSLNGGWQIGASNADNPIITNNKFIVGANARIPIDLLGEPNGFTGVGATIKNNTIDGAGVCFFDTFVRTSRGGDMVIQYNLISNSCTDWLTMGGTELPGCNPNTYDIRFNVFYNAVQSTDPDIHGDWWQTFEGRCYDNITANYNLIYQVVAGDPAVGTQGLTLDGNCKSPPQDVKFLGGSVSNNTMIALLPAGRVNFYIGISTNSTTGTWNILNNRIDPSSMTGPTISNTIRDTTCPGVARGGTATITGNIDMLTGNTLNFLLKRDLDPAANDNTPAWLNQAA